MGVTWGSFWMTMQRRPTLLQPATSTKKKKDRTVLTTHFGIVTIAASIRVTISTNLKKCI
jgi:hypothetical protein